MSAALTLIRTKPDLIDDPDPTLGIFVPPTPEIWVPRTNTRGFRIGLVYAAAAFTCTVRVFARNATDGTWFLAGIQALVPNRRLVTQDDVGPHDLWFGLVTCTGGNPIQVWVEEIFPGEQS